MGDLTPLLKLENVLTFIILILVLYLFVSNVLKGYKKIKIGKIELDKGEPDRREPQNKKGESQEKNFEGFEYFFSELQKLHRGISEIRGLFDSTHQDIKSLSDSVQNIKIDQQKQLFYSPDLNHRPAEKLVAGLKYVVLYKGNGDVKKDVKKFVQGSPEIYQGIIATMPELKLTD